MRVLGVPITRQSSPPSGFGPITPALLREGLLLDPNATAGLPIVYACLHYLTQSIAGMPLRVVDEFGLDQQIPAWLTQPSPMVSDLDLIKQIVVSITQHGNAYLVPIRSQGEMFELHCLPPEQVQVRESVKGGVSYWLMGRDFTADIIHLRLIPIAGRATGLSAWDVARQAVKIGIASQDFIRRHFTQSAHLQMLLTAKGNASTEDLAEVVAQISARHMGGADRAWAPLALSGEWDLKPMSMTTEQAKFVELTRMTNAQIASHVFRVDPALVNVIESGTTLTYSNWQDRTAHTYEVTLRPLAQIIEAAISRLLPAGLRLDLDARAFLSGTNRDKHQEAAIMKSTGCFTLNEVRRKLGYSPIEGGDELCDASSTALVIGGDAPMNEKPVELPAEAGT